jgi:hypothetical protein
LDPNYKVSLHMTVGASGLPDCIPTTTLEAKLQTLFLVIGACIVAGIFGEMASLLGDFNSENTEYHRKISLTMTQLKQMQVPGHLQKRARQYLEYTYQKHRWQKHHGLFSTLSPVLATEIYGKVERHMISKAFTFSQSSTKFLNALVLRLLPITLQHNDAVVTEGEFGEEMFFLRHGLCRVRVN